MTRTARAKAKRPKPLVYWIRRFQDHWECVGPVGVVLVHGVKRGAERLARARIRQMHATDGKPRQLRIRDRKGRICAEASYGANSKRRKG